MNQNKCDARRKRRNDIVFILALVIICASVGLSFLFLREVGDSVTVTIDGSDYGTYALSNDVTVEIKNTDGAVTNILIIKDGKAHVEYASCPDGICVAHKPILREGESIVCLPNRVVITVVSSESSNEPDIKV